jgi:hypothetical protein
VAEDEWAEDIGGIPCPDWTKVFGFTADCKLLCTLRIVVLCHVLSKHSADELGHFPAVLRRRKVEAHGDFILGPVSPKEYKDTVAELNGSRTNRVFEFFKIAPPKHRKAAEKKAAAVAAAEADVEETATSPRAAPQKTSRRSAPAAATAAAEGKARKKRGGRPADSPPSPKRTHVIDVETGVVEDVIDVVPLRAAAPSDVPSATAGAGAAGPLLVPLSPQEKDSDDDSDVRMVSSVGDAPRKLSPAALGAEAP